MRYTKLLTSSGATYATVEDRGNALWAVAPMPSPEEDPNSPRPFTPAPLASFTLLPPVRPSKIVCIGRNYKDHAAELGNDVPAEPLLFLKPPSALLASGGVIRMPAVSARVDFEGELAIVIGRRCSGFGPGDDPRDFIRGFVLVNDVTARDLQKSDPQWTRGKGFDTFCPTGPVVAVLDPGGSISGAGEIDPLTSPVTITTRLNGSLRQTGSTADLIFPIPHLLAYISACMTLEPGDLIPTGTPAGVGPMQPGDTVEVHVPGLGTLTNCVASA